MISLRNKTTFGIIWSLVQSVGARGISFIVTIILARILTPEDFGLVGMLTVFMQLSQAAVNAGFNQALIQKQDVGEKDYSSVFWLNLVISVLLYLLLFLIAPFVADFYNQPMLTLLTRVLSLVFLINAFSYVQETRMTKEMRFKTLTLINLPSVFVGGITGVGMALLGYGIWSIIFVQLISRLLFTIQLWYHSKWTPSAVYRRTRVKKLFIFGSRLLIAEVIHILYQNVYLIIIGRFYVLSSVGYYQNANNLVNVPSNTFSNALNKVTFPVFSSIQDETVKLKEGFRKIILQSVFWLCPLFVFTAILAEPLFNLVFTEKWQGAIPIFQILCIGGIFTPINNYNLSIINVKGRSDLFLKIEIIKKIIITIGVLFLIPFGIWALVVFQATSAVITFVLNSYYSGKFIAYPMLAQLRDIGPIFILTAICGLIVLMLTPFLSGFSDWVHVLFGLFCSAFIYWGGAKYLKLTPYLDVVHMCKRGPMNVLRVKQ